MRLQWTPERVDKLKGLHAQGLSSGLIAEQLGVTRNAIIGKCHRLGLSRKRDEKVQRKQKAKKARSNSNSGGFWLRLNSILRDAENATRDLPVDHSPLATTIEGLLNDRSQCRYPVTTPEGECQLFCAADVVEGTPYCARHCAVCYRPSRYQTFRPLGDVVNRVVEDLGQRNGQQAA